METVENMSTTETLNPDSQVEENQTPEEEFSPAQRFTEDFVVTSLLSAGRPLRVADLAARAQGWTLHRQALREALRDSKRVQFSPQERLWDCRWRLERRHLPREERFRIPIEALLREFLLLVGKPLPAPVIAREIGAMRNFDDPQLKEIIANLLKNARFALEVAPGVYLHESFGLEVGAPRDDVLIRENGLDRDPDFEGLIEFAEISATQPAEIARELMEFTGGPLSQKVIGFFVRRANPNAFSPRELARVLNDRTQFQPLLQGFVALQDQLGALQEATQEFLEELGGGPQEPLDTAALLRQRVPASQIIVPAPETLARLKKLGINDEGAVLDVASVVLDVLDADADDPNLVAQLQGIIDALQKSSDWMPAGIGQFLLRESVPLHVGTVPQMLKPITLEVKNREGEYFDIELEDAALDGESAAFVHAPQWEDVEEESEVQIGKVSVRSAKIPILNHHFRAGTVKIRQLDGDLWDLTLPFSQITLTPRDAEEAPFQVWASRETGLITDLNAFYDENLPPSGGILHIEREGETLYVSPGQPEARVFLTERRLEELEPLQDGARFLSLFELLQKVLADRPNGVEIAGLWAEVNVLRRTSKRLLASVLSAYDNFSAQSRGPHLFVWKLNERESGFDKSKKKFLKK